MYYLSEPAEQQPAIVASQLKQGAVWTSQSNSDDQSKGIFDRSASS